MYVWCVVCGVGYVGIPERENLVCGVWYVGIPERES